MNKAFNVNTENLNTLVLIVGRQHLRIIKRLGLSLLLVFTLAHCYAAELSPNATTTTQASMKSEESHMWITIGERHFLVTLADTKAAREFASMLPLTLDMDDLHSNEKHAELPKALPTDQEQPKIIHNGNLMLWGSSTIVVFYKDFNTSYTRIGHIKDAAYLPQELGRGSIRVTFSTH
jgi:hypothetical protein